MQLISFTHSSTRHLGRSMLALSIASLLLFASILPAAAQDPTITPEPTPSPLPPTPAAAQITGLTHVYQTWNNCGGANLTMAMSYFGWSQDQDVARAWLKPNVEDKNVSPGEMVAFVNTQATGLETIGAIWRFGGNLDLIKGLIAAGFPVIVEAGYDVDNKDWMGHYETIAGYDDATQTIWVQDSYLGPNQTRTYADFDYWWRHFNRTFIVLFDMSRTDELRAIMGYHIDPAYAAQSALDAARAEASASPGDAWAWFNMGVSYTKLNDYESAVTAFEEAFRLGLPYRLLWYMFQPFEAYYNLGRYDDVMNLTFNTEQSTIYVEEIYFWRGMVYAAKGQNDLAVNEFNRVLTFNRNFSDAQFMKEAVLGGTFTPPVVAAVSGG